ncbi:MAG: N-acetylmuramoyl-L-alanine amidase [Candidatus Korobacteraceae bacterium]
MLVFAVLLGVAPGASAYEAPADPAAQSVARKKQLALKYFEEAERMREALNGRPAQNRSLEDYGFAMQAYRRVYYTSPSSPKAHVSVVAVAELLAECGRVLNQEKSLRDAIGQYEFLRKEYPGSRYRFEALFIIAQIYKDELQDAAAAKATFQEFLKQYPDHALAAEARDGIIEIEQLAKAKEEAARNPKAADIAAARPNSRILVTGVRHWSTPEYTRVVVDLEREVEFTIGQVESPDRIFFDLKNTSLATMLRGKSYDVADGFLRQIRLGQYRPDETRIVLDVSAVSDYSAFFLPNPPRLIVDIRGEAPSAKTDVLVAGNAAPAKQAPATVVETAAAKVPPSKVEPAPAPPASEPEIHQARPTRKGQRSLVRALGLKIGRIVVDAGHGGHDTGTVASNGLQEKDLVLDVARRLGSMLEEELGAEVVYTRDNDTFVPLETRTAIANQKEADLFISIHANSSPRRATRGVETYFLNFTSSADALEVAARENAVSEKSIHELQDLVQKIALKDKIEESREFAIEVQRSLHTGLYGKTPVRDRGVRQAPFIVLIGANMPSILAEISFVSNPLDARQLKTPAHRQKIAASIYKGVSRYISGLSGLKVAAKSEGGEVVSERQ